MKTQSKRNENGWRTGSASSPLSVLAAAGLVGLGINGLLRPGSAAEIYGLPLSDPRDLPFARVKAARDLTLGLLPLAFRAFGMRKALGIYWIIAAIVPTLDALLVVLSGGGGKPWKVGQHVGAAGFAMALGATLLRGGD